MATDRPNRSVSRRGARAVPPASATPAPAAIPDAALAAAGVAAPATSGTSGVSDAPTDIADLPPSPDPAEPRVVHVYTRRERAELEQRAADRAAYEAARRAPEGRKRGGTPHDAEREIPRAIESQSAPQSATNGENAGNTSTSPSELEE